VNTRTLLREVEKLEAERLSGRPDIPADRDTFARDLGIIPDLWQDRLLRSDAPRVLLNCCRQSGKSTMAALLALHRALTVPGSLVLCLAPALRQSQELFGKVLGFYRDLGRPIAADAEQRLGLELAKRSRIAALPGSERTVRGFSGVDLLIVDEAARVDDALVYSIRPMLAVSGGRLLMLSTPYGKRGVFYEEWTGGEGWERFEIPASQCPRIPPAFLEAERRSMPEWWFAQEYGVEFREALDQLFTSEMIEGARADDLQEYRFEGDEELWNIA
jgi:hypothetical protein